MFRLLYINKNRRIDQVYKGNRVQKPYNHYLYQLYNVYHYLQLQAQPRALVQKRLEKNEFYEVLIDTATN